jgi:hypothetical protein
MAPLSLVEVALKHFYVSVSLGSSELTEAVADFDLFERWLEEQLSHVTLLFEGYGQVRVHSDR